MINLIASRDCSDGQVRKDRRTIAITVKGVNDPPVLTVPGSNFNTEEHTHDKLSYAIESVEPIVCDEDTELEIENVHVRDVDILDPNQGEVRVSISVKHGTVSFEYLFQEDYEKCPELPSLVFLYGNGRNDSSCTFYGTLTAVNLAFSKYFRFTGLRDYFGEASVNIVVSDIGQSGLGKPLQDTQVIPIFVRPINDPPEIIVPVHEDGSSTFRVNEDSLVHIDGAINPDFTHSHLKGQRIELGSKLYKTVVERSGTQYNWFY